jgi:hypothetical protein
MNPIAILVIIIVVAVTTCVVVDKHVRDNGGINEYIWDQSLEEIFEL